MARKHEIRREHLVGADQQPPQQDGGDAERWVRDHSERTPRQPQVRRVCLHHDDWRVAEPVAKYTRSLWMQLNRDNTRTTFDQRSRDRARPCPDIDDDVTRVDARPVDKLKRGVVSEPMPAPAGACPAGGHDAPSQPSRAAVSPGPRSRANDLPAQSTRGPKRAPIGSCALR
jgi:hypothetical protein